MNFNNPAADFGAYQPPTTTSNSNNDVDQKHFAHDNRGAEIVLTSEDDDGDDNPFSLPPQLRPDNNNRLPAPPSRRRRRSSNASGGTDTSGFPGATVSHANQNYTTSAALPPTVILRPIVGDSNAMNPHTPFHDNASALSGATGNSNGPVDFMPLSEFDQQPNNFNGAAGSRAPTTHYVKGHGWFLSRNVLIIGGIVILALIIVIIGLAVGLGKRSAANDKIVIVNNSTKDDTNNNSGPIVPAAVYAGRMHDESTTITPETTTPTTTTGDGRESRILVKNDEPQEAEEEKTTTTTSTTRRTSVTSTGEYPTPSSLDSNVDRLLIGPMWNVAPIGATSMAANATTTTTWAPVFDEADAPDNASIRLPLTFIPKHYNVQLWPVLEPPADFRFSGSVEIDMVSSPNRTLMSDRIVLHSKALVIDKQNVTVFSVVSEEYDMAPKQLQVVDITEDVERDFLILQLSETVAPSTTYRVALNFNGTLTRNLVGIYLSSYNTTEPDGSNTTHWLMASQMQPTDARRVFPMFDEPAFKATFNVTMIHAKNLTALSNMPLLQPTQPHPTQSELVIDRFAPTPPMSTYLLAFVLTDMHNIQRNTTSGTKVRIWARPSILPNAQFALDLSVRLVDYFENYFQLAYPLKILDQVAVPNMYMAGMENWGLILYQEDSLVFNSDVNPADQRKTIVGTVAHQIAHQWFGNLVGPAWWDDLWLNEGFATYVQYVGGNRVRPEWHYMNDFLVDEMQNAMTRDALRTTHPIRVPVYRPDEISQLFDDITLGKGASILRMLRYFLGETLFSRGINKYLRQFEYSTATTDDLWQQLSLTARAAGRADIDVKRVMDSWTLQPGMPVVHILRRNNSDGQPVMHVSQERFLLLDNATISNYSNYEQLWHIPLTIMPQTYDKPLDDVSTLYNYSAYSLNGQDETIWLTDQTMTLTKLNAARSMPATSRHWILANILQSGFFRVNYDNTNWRLLLAQLVRSPQVIHVANRAQLVDDAFNLARAGYLPSYDIPLGMVRSYLPDETDYLPWQAAINNIEHLDFMLRSTPDYDALRDLMLRVLAPIATKLDLWNITQTVMSAAKADNDALSILPDLTTIKMRTLIYSTACYYDMLECTEHAKQLFNIWMIQHEGSKQARANLSAANPIPVDFKQSMYTTAVRLGGVAEWDFAWEVYTTTKDPVEQMALINAMSATREPWLLRRFLRMALDEQQIKRSHVLTIFGAVAVNSETGQKIAWEMFVEDWPSLRNRFGGQPFTLADAIEQLLASGNTVELFGDVQRFAEDNKDNLGTARQALAQGLEMLQANIAWMRDSKDRAVMWLQVASAVSQFMESAFTALKPTA